MDGKINIGNKKEILWKVVAFEDKEIPKEVARKQDIQLVNREEFMQGKYVFKDGSNIIVLDEHDAEGHNKDIFYHGVEQHIQEPSLLKALCVLIKSQNAKNPLMEFCHPEYPSQIQNFISVWEVRKGSGNQGVQNLEMIIQLIQNCQNIPSVGYSCLGDGRHNINIDFSEINASHQDVIAANYFNSQSQKPKDFIYGEYNIFIGKNSNEESFPNAHWGESIKMKTLRKQIEEGKYGFNKWQNFLNQLNLNMKKAI